MYSVLIVEDEERIREGLKVVISWNALGFDIKGECDNGASALRELKTGKYDLLLCDIRLPVMSGIELLKELAKSGVNCKTIIISGFADFTYAKEAIDYGVKKYLLKPINEVDLANTVSAIRVELNEERGGDEASFSGLDTRITNYIEKNYTQNVSVKQIADEMGYNTCYIGRYFTQKTGMSLKEYLYMYRVKKSIKLLIEGRLNVQDIAYEVGFRDVVKFYQAFRKYKGTTPKGYLSGLNGHADKATEPGEQPVSQN